MCAHHAAGNLFPDKCLGIIRIFPCFNGVLYRGNRRTHPLAHGDVSAGFDHAGAIGIARMHPGARDTQFLQRFEQTLDEEHVGGNAHRVLKGESSFFIDCVVSGEIRLGRDVVSHRNAGIVHGNEYRPSKIESDPLARIRIRLVVHMRPQDEDRFRVLLHKRMHTKISGRFRRGGKNGSRTAETHAATQQRRRRKKIPSTEHGAPLRLVITLESVEDINT